MLVDKIVDKTIHNSHTGDHQAVGNLVQRRKQLQRSDTTQAFGVVRFVHRLYCCYY